MLFGVLKDDVMRYFKSRGRLGFIVVLFLCALLMLRLSYLQVFKFEELTRLSENNRIRVISLRADRGFIKDRNGFLLVRNAPAYEIEVIKEDVDDMNDLLTRLSAIVNFDMERVKKRIRQSGLYEPVRVARGLSMEEVSYIMQHSSEYSGLQVGVDPIRSYVDGDVLSHVLGYLGEVSDEDVGGSKGYRSGDIAGRTGIEKEFDNVLRGTRGAQQVEVDSVGRVMEVLNEDPATPGNNLILTVDYRLQNYASELLDGRAGAVVVLDIEDNSVLSMYSAPTYDLSLFAPFISTENWAKLNDPKKIPLINRAVEGAYAPGSVYKIIVAAAALKEGLIKPETKFYCSGTYRVPGSNNTITCWKKHGHGDMNLRQALAESCDTYFYNVGSLLGIDKLNEYSTLHGLGKLTGITLPNEKSGIFPSREWKQRVKNEAWYPGDTVNISIGQGFMTATPLQIAVMYASLFNGGITYAPRIVDAFEDPVTGEHKKLPAVEVAKDPMDESIRKVVMDGLVMSVDGIRGTSTRARVPGLTYGGKTGTAQVINLKRIENLSGDEIPEHWRDHSWYAGVYPAEKPRYVVVVLLEHGGSGSKSSAPVAGAIIKRMLELGYVSKN